MDIQRMRSGLPGLDPKTSDAAGADRPSRAPSVEPSAADGGDRIELSEAARAQSSEAPAPEVRDATLERAREALRDWPTLDPERKAMILARLEDGFYSQPETVRQVAERLYDDLRGTPPETR